MTQRIPTVQKLANRRHATHATIVSRCSWASRRLWPSILALVFIASINPAVSFATDNTPGTPADSSTTATNAEPLDIEYPDWFKTSFMELEEDIQEARDAGKYLMLVFHQPGCPYCNALVERNLAQKDIEEKVRSNFDVIEINMWGDLEVVDVGGAPYTEKTFARYLNVQFTPTVLMYDQNGKIALRINGYYPPDKFRAALDYAIGKDTINQSFNEYLATLNSAEPESKADKSQLTTHDYIKLDDFATDQSITLPDATTKKPYILLFEQMDCSNCVQLHDSVLAETDTRSMLENFDVIRIDMWGNDPIQQHSGTQTTGRALAKELGINYAPTMVVYSANQDEVIRSESWLKRFHTQSILDYVESGAWKQQPSFQIFLRERADSIRENGGVVNILD